MRHLHGHRHAQAEDRDDLVPLDTTVCFNDALDNGAR